jgi:nitrate/nitrite-specific signal transduction histidine kinase
MDMDRLGARWAEHIGASEAMLVEDVSQDPRIARLVVGSGEAQSFACVPLRSKGRVLGALSVATPRPRTLTADDIGLLRVIANQIAVAVDNAELFEEAQWRERETEALYKVSQEILALLDIDKILGSVLENAAQLLRTEAAALALLDEKTGELFMKATRGICTEEFKRMRIARGSGMAGVIIRTGQAVKVEDYEQSPYITHELDDLIRGEGVKALLGAPLKTGGRFLGIIYVLQRETHHFSEHDVSLLDSLATQATIALENARLYDQVQQLAILSERGRIAREMHDGLAQVLGYLLLSSRTLANLLSSGRVPESFDELEKMRETIREAYNDVRASILGLRTGASIERKGLMSGLAEYLEDFTFQTGIQATLEVDGQRSIALAPSAETQLVRVIQEALTNVRKHSLASRAWVRIERDGDQAVVTIEDDGRGFDSTPRSEYQSPGHFGLEIMRERAESVGGSLEITSQPGHGTRVIVRMPCALAPLPAKN